MTNSVKRYVNIRRYKSEHTDVQTSTCILKLISSGELLGHFDFSHPQSTVSLSFIKAFFRSAFAQSLIDGAVLLVHLQCINI